MIETTEYDKIPATVLHRITGEIGVDEVERSMPKTHDVVTVAINKYGRFNFIIDCRGLNFTDDAHMLWKLKIEGEPRFKEKINYLVFILDYSSKARAAKKRRETETVKFFYDFDEGSNWLESKAGSIKSEGEISR
jgi:hypothetical protein